MENSTTEYFPLEQPNEIAVRDKEDAMGAYLMMFGALAAGLPLPIINLIAAVVYYAVNAKKSRFIKFHSLQSLLSQAPTTLMNAGLLFWVVQIWFHKTSDSGFEFMGQYAEFNDIFWAYVWTVIAANLMYFIFSIVGAMKARKGEMYYFLFFGRLSYHYAYRKTGREGMKSASQNLPPQ